MKSILLILGVLLISACTDLKRPEQKVKLDIIKSDLILVEESSENLDIDSILVVVSEIERVEGRIKNYFQYDTLSLELIEQLDQYKRIHPSLLFIVNAKKTIDSSLESRIESLESLQSDIENSVGDRPNYDKFIVFENNQVKELSDFVNYCDSSRRASFKTFHNLHTSIETFSLNLEKENQEQ